MSIHVYFNPLDTACKTITGAIHNGEKVQFNLYLLNETAKATPYDKKNGVFCAQTPNVEAKPHNSNTF